MTNEGYEVLLLDSDDPKTYCQAMTSNDYEIWLKAMKSKINSMFVIQGGV